MFYPTATTIEFRLPRGVGLGLVLFLSTAAHGLLAVAEELPEDYWFFRQNEVRVAYAAGGFVGDGAIGEAEIAASTEVRQFVTFERDARGDNRVSVHWAHDGNRLYAGVRVRQGGGSSLVAAADQRDDPALWEGDDAVEIRFVIGEEVFGFIGNSAGIRGDRMYEPDDAAWSHAGWSYAARVTDFGWEAEFVFESSVFGLAEFQSGAGVQADVFHRRSSGIDIGWAYQGGSFGGQQEAWPLLVFGGPDEVFQTRQEIGELPGDDYGIDVTLRNPAGAAREVEAWVWLYRVRGEFGEYPYHSTLAGIFDRTGVEVNPGATDEELLEWALFDNILPEYARGNGWRETISVSPRGEARAFLRRPYFPGTYLLAYRFADPDGGQISAGVYPIVKNLPLTTRVEYHYLTANEIELVTEIPDLAAVAALRYTVYTAGSSGAIDELMVAGVQRDSVEVTAMSAEGWPGGDLLLTVEALDGDGETLISREVLFEKPHDAPFWHLTDAGNLIEVSHLWTPVEATPSWTRVWGREYTWNGSLLPEQIRTQGQDLLAAPARLRLRLDGEIDPRAWTVTDFGLADSSDGRAIYQGEAAAGGLRWESRVTVEFDGLARFDWTVEPAAGPVEVAELFLEIPMKREHAEIFGRSRALGMMPEEDTPAAWQETYPLVGLTGEATVNYPFTPVIHLRTDEIGLEWVAEQDWDWSNESALRKVEIVPEGDEVLLRVRLVDRKTRFDGPREFTFGLTAWPVRPWPEDRQNVSNYLGHFIASNDTSDPRRSMGSTLEEVRDNLRAAIDRGLDVMWIFHWISATRPDGGQIASNYPEPYDETVEANLRLFADATQAEGVPVMGHAGFVLPPEVSDYHFYGMEMLRRPLQLRGAAGAKPCANSPYTDAFVGRFKLLAEEYGWSGAQLDEALYPRFCDSHRHGCGRLEPDGSRRGSFPLFAFREMARRLYNVFHGEVEFPGIEHGYIYNHVGRTTTGMVDAFSNSIHSGEDPVTMRVDALSEIDLQRERALYPIRAFGVPRDWLLKLAQSNLGPRARIATAVQLNMNMQHLRILSHPNADYERNTVSVHKLWEARDWIGARDDNFYPSWSNGEYVDTGVPDMYAAFYLEPGERMLLAVSNWQSEARGATVQLNLAGLGLDGGALQAEDAITGEPVALTANALQLDVTADGYRLIKIWKQ